MMDNTFSIGLTYGETGGHYINLMPLKPFFAKWAIVRLIEWKGVSFCVIIFLSLKGNVVIRHFLIGKHMVCIE